MSKNLYIQIVKIEDKCVKRFIYQIVNYDGEDRFLVRRININHPKRGELDDLDEFKNEIRDMMYADKNDLVLAFNNMLMGHSPCDIFMTDSYQEDRVVKKSIVGNNVLRSINDVMEIISQFLNIQTIKNITKMASRCF